METLHLSIKESIGTITFNRPDVLNALNTMVFDELNHCLDALEQSRDLKAVIFTGEGKAFIAGADIAEMKEKTPEQALTFSKYGHVTFNRIEQFKVPVFAAVNGFALGGGLELALACDFIIASDKAKFSAPEVNLGLIPGFNGTQRLPRIIGAANAKYMLFTSEMVDANNAFRMGLVQKVVPHTNLIDEALKIAQTIVNKGPNAIQSAKATINFGLLNGYKLGSENEPIAFSKVFNKQGKEGMAAFIEKRKPNWDNLT